MEYRTVQRPYVMRGPSGTMYPLTSEEAQRLIDAYPLARGSLDFLMLRGEDGLYVISPATLGGGPAFEKVS